MMRRTLLITAVVSAALHGDLHGPTPPPARTTLWVTLGDIDELVEVDPYTFKEIRHRLRERPDPDRPAVRHARDQPDPVGKFPHWFTTRADGNVAFVSLWDSDAIDAIDVASRKVLTNVQFTRGTGPKRIMVASKQ